MLPALGEFTPSSAFVILEPGGGSIGDPVLGFSSGSKRADLLAVPVRPNDFDVPHILSPELSRLKGRRMIAIGHSVRLCTNLVLGTNFEEKHKQQINSMAIAHVLFTDKHKSQMW